MKNLFSLIACLVIYVCFMQSVGAQTPINEYNMSITNEYDAQQEFPEASCVYYNEKSPPTTTAEYESETANLTQPARVDEQTALAETVGDSLKLIEDILGVKLTSTNDFGGGVQITEVFSNSMFYAQAAKVRGIIIKSVQVCTKQKVHNTTELCQVLFTNVRNGYPIIILHGIANNDTTTFNLSNYTKNSKAIDFSALLQRNILANDTLKKLTEAELKAYANCMFFNTYDPMAITLVSTFTGILFGWYGAIFYSAIPLLDFGPPSAPAYVLQQAETLDKSILLDKNNGTDQVPKSGVSNSKNKKTSADLNNNYGGIYYKAYAKQRTTWNHFSRILGSFAGAGIWCMVIVLLC